MYCIHCGNPLDPHGKFCAGCGKAVDGLLQPSSTASDPVPVPRTPQSTTSGIGAAAQGASDTVGVAQVRPWVRYFARIIDLMFWALPGGFILGMVAPDFALSEDPGNEYLVGMVVLLMWAFVEPLCLVVFGTTPGKSLLRVRLVYTGSGSLSYGTAMARSLKVWWRGLGTGFPLVSLITLIIAYQRLSKNRKTSWDEEGGFIVEHGKIGWPRAALATVLIVLYFMFVGALESM